MSRSASSLISSQTSNWISTRTDPCSDLLVAMAAEVVDVGSRRLAVSIGSSFLLFCCSASGRGLRRLGDGKPLRGGLVSMSIVPEIAQVGQWGDRNPIK